MHELHALSSKDYIQISGFQPFLCSDPFFNPM